MFLFFFFSNILFGVPTHLSIVDFAIRTECMISRPPGSVTSFARYFLNTLGIYYSNFYLFFLRTHNVAGSRLLLLLSSLLFSQLSSSLFSSILKRRPCTTRSYNIIIRFSHAVLSKLTNSHSRVHVHARVITRATGVY